MSKLREKILTAKDIQKELVHVDLWGVDIEARGLTGDQRLRITESATHDGMIDSGALVAAAIIEGAFDPESGEQIFAEADRDAILQKAGSAIDLVGGVILRLSGMTPDSREAIRKNSATASGASGSDSPSPSI